MCGIAGFCGFGQNYKENQHYWNDILISMRKSIAHRGNDNTGEFLESHIGLGHTRLSIRDLSFGAQPIIREVNNILIFN